MWSYLWSLQPAGMLSTNMPGRSQRPWNSDGPDRYTSNIRKINWQGKIFIDWLRNNRTATTVAPYSIRARLGAPVSMPVFREELDTVVPNGISMDEALTRISGKDPGRDF